MYVDISNTANTFLPASTTSSTCMNVPSGSLYHPQFKVPGSETYKLCSGHEFKRIIWNILNNYLDICPEVH